MVRRNVLFDLDGTLIDSAPSILESFAAVLESLGVEPAVPLCSSLIGPPLLQTMRHISGIQDDARLNVMVSAFKSHYDEVGYRGTIAYPGVADTLTQLHQRGDRLFIVTNKRIEPARKILEYLGWTGWFAGVYAQDAFVPALTSKAAVIEKVMRSHQIDAANAVYVGDRQEDGEAARANQLRFIWTRWGYGAEVDSALYREGDRIAAPHQLLDSVAGGNAV